MIKPVGDWKQIFAPSEHSRYINDHTIFADKSGQFHLLGTTSSKNYAVFREKYFVDASSDELDGTFTEKRLILGRDPHAGIKISPYVFFSEENKLFHLFFGPGKIYHYVSSDGNDWKYQSVAIKSAWPFTRDPYILFYKNKYLMYLTGSNNRVIIYESIDLDNWKFAGTALRLGLGSPRSVNSACESPAVIYHDKGYYLFTTIVPALIGTKKYYNNTLIFRSDDPLDFGIYKGKLGQNAKLVGSLEAHAPEIIVANKKIYYTSCGWTGMPKPEGIFCDGVCLRELKID